MASGVTTSRGRREEVLLAAATVFSTHGYRASTIQDIARELGFTSAALYYYFDSKERMLTELIMRPMRMLVEQAEEVAAMGATSHLDSIRELVHRHINLILNEYDLFSILLRERLELSTEAADQLRQVEAEYYEHISGLIDRCAEAGEAAVSSSNLAALALIGMMNWVLRWYNRDGSMSPDEIAETFFEIFHRGIAARPDLIAGTTTPRT